MKLNPIALGVSVLILSACGGGGDSSSGTAVTPATPPAAATQTVKGVAATGAAMQGATVILNDATGKAVNCPADATTGAFSCEVTSLTAPFVLSAHGNVSDSQDTLYSVSAAAGSQTINITPLTNAISATLAGGNPATLVSDSSLLKSKVTTTTVTTTMKAYADVLADLMSATGNAGVNLISGTLTAGGPGLDKLLDVIRAQVLPDGRVQLSSVAGVSSDAPVMLTLAPGAAPQASDKASLPTVATINGAPVASLPTVSDLDGLKAAFNQCFSGSTGAKRTSGAAAGCNKIFVDDVAPASLLSGVPATYMGNGRTVDQEFGSAPAGGTPGIAADDGMNNAVFGLEIVQVLAADKVWVKVTWRRTDNSQDGMDLIVQKAVQPAALSAGDAGWRVIGNQRRVLSKVYAGAQKWDFLNPANVVTGVNVFTSTLGMQVGTTDSSGVAVDFAIVKGPGLRNGIFLQPSTGACDTLNIRAQIAVGQTPADLALLAKYNSCRGNFRLSAVAQDPAQDARFKWPVGNTAWATPQLTAAEIDAIKPFSVYTIDIYQGGITATPAKSYKVTMRTPPLQPADARQYQWNNVAQATRDLLYPTSASAYTGGATFPVTWTPTAGVPFVKKVQAQVRSTIGANPTVFVSGSARVTPSAGSATTANVSGDGGASYPAVVGSGAAGSGDFGTVTATWNNTADLTFTALAEYDH